MRLILVRHGETEANRLGLTLGRADVPLNDRGRWQAQRLAEALRRKPVAAVYSSPLRRALDTARSIAQPHGLTVEVEPGLIEMDIGQTEGLSLAEVRSRYPGLLERWLSEDGPQQVMPGGERLMDVQARAWQAVESLRLRYHDGVTVVVSHNFPILSVLARALGIELAQFRRLRHDVAAIAVLDWRDDQVRVERLNDTSHLEQED